MILNKVFECTNVNDVIEVIDNYTINQIKNEILSISGAALANKNKGLNTPIFNFDLPIIRSIYAACLSVLGNDYRPREQTKLNCEVVIGNARTNGFIFYSKEDIFLAVIGNKICNEIGGSAI